MQAHGVKQDKWAIVITPYLIGKALQAYQALSDSECEDYATVRRQYYGDIT